MTAKVDSAILSSQVYNPSYDEQSVGLLRLMARDGYSDELLAEYIEMFKELPTSNPYLGVLYNPRACEIDAATTDIDKIREELRNRYEDILGNGNPGNNPTSGQIIDLADWQQYYPGIDQSLSQNHDLLKEYRDHTDRIVANLPMILSTIQGSIGNNSAMNGVGQGGFGGIDFGGGLGGSLPCVPFADILGSILQAGQQVLSQIMGALAGVAGVVQQALSVIQGAIAKLTQMVQQAMAMIQAEIAKLAAGMLNMIQMGLAQLMSFLPNDPCLKAIMGGMITGAASKVMGGAFG